MNDTEWSHKNCPYCIKFKTCNLTGEGNGCGGEQFKAIGDGSPIDAIKDAIFEYIRKNDDKLDRIDVVSHFGLPADLVYRKITHLVNDDNIRIVDYPTLVEPGKHRIKVISRTIDCICGYLGPSKMEDDLCLCPECDTSFIHLKKGDAPLPVCKTCGGELEVVGSENEKTYCRCKTCKQDVWV